jgi:hypothetical protein
VFFGINVYEIMIIIISKTSEFHRPQNIRVSVEVPIAHGTVSVPVTDVSPTARQRSDTVCLAVGTSFIVAPVDRTRILHVEAPVVIWQLHACRWGFPPALFFRYIVFGVQAAVLIVGTQRTA